MTAKEKALELMATFDYLSNGNKKITKKIAYECVHEIIKALQEIDVSHFKIPFWIEVGYEIKKINNQSNT